MIVPRCIRNNLIYVYIYPRARLRAMRRTHFFSPDSHELLTRHIVRGPCAPFVSARSAPPLGRGAWAECGERREVRAVFAAAAESASSRRGAVLDRRVRGVEQRGVGACGVLFLGIVQPVRGTRAPDPRGAAGHHGAVARQLERVPEVGSAALGQAAVVLADGHLPPPTGRDFSFRI